jgi:hypothetical protein
MKSGETVPVISVVDRFRFDRFDADPDPAFHYDADQNSV